MLRFVRAALLALWCTMPALAGNWPAWRGPDGSGHSPEKDLPVKWSDTENVRWKVDRRDDHGVAGRFRRRHLDPHLQTPVVHQREEVTRPFGASAKRLVGARADTAKGTAS
jgi:hypothetical protein